VWKELEMFSCNKHETRCFLEGRATGVVRRYSEEHGCPHEPGSEIVLTSQFLDGKGTAIPFAKATVVSVRPGTIAQFERDSGIARMDGFGAGKEWKSWAKKMLYPGIHDDAKVYHLKLRITELDKTYARKAS
jgi:hypothetical protein